MTAIGQKYSQLGGHGGFLGRSSTTELVCADAIGHYNHFQRGSIYWHPDVGAFEVHGAIRDKWTSLGWEKSFLGYPKSDECSTPDGVGRYNHFQGGSIYWHPDVGAFEVHGAIRDKWASLGWEKSFLGYPKSDENIEADGTCRCSYFQRGFIYFHPNIGAFAIADDSIVFYGGSIDPNFGCQWPGEWQSNWASPTGWYLGNMNIDEKGKGLLRHNVPPGDYSTLSSGSHGLVTDSFGTPVAYRWTGQWKREKGDSGGSTQYGQFVLDLSYDNISTNCKFIGFWTYGNDNPLSNTNRYLWQGY